MDRLTRPGIDAEQTAVRFMDGAVKIQGIGDKVLELILNGPTINGVNKDTLRHLVRQLYTELKQIEDILGDTYDLEQLQELMEGHKNPKPLTIEELLQMPGEPVWIRKLDSDKAFWMLVYPDIVSNRIGYLEYRSYGIEWIAFRQKPEA